ncbi:MULTISPECIES: hypothetical protein [unclassified Rhizobium]|jgi:hypothetical protein|uniref:hypothetical protein n=1 Tax=unclassified Rhizobium TaxID=2613769 RepID=UPI0005647E30|nr:MULTISPECIES: hypothetical protein [unclassified Rhizobium]MBB3399226.1 hypothetical protein [Rhizobium sp. BK060]MBB4169887.1 hypothetical protein [Rhizobium sp. BK538]OWV95526.1 hypothetical protein ATY81_10150 [Rhizobium sp. R72]OWV95826.1 hypothetical protein ATY80_10150 [Rhizobium sp. R711]
MGEKSSSESRPCLIDLVIVGVVAGLLACLLRGGNIGAIAPVGLGTALSWYFLGFPIIRTRNRSR